MDWAAIGHWLGTLAASALGTGFVVRIWEQRIQRQDKLEERAAARADRLRQAHAQFIASYLKLLAVGEELHRASMTKLHHEDPDSPPEPDDLSSEEYSQLCEDHRQLTKATSVAAIEANARIVEALLLESRPDIQVRLHALLNNPWRHQVAYFEALEDFKVDIASRRAALDKITRALSATASEGRGSLLPGAGIESPRLTPGP
jgi:hypothetical protein